MDREPFMRDTGNVENGADNYPGVTRPATWFLPNDPPDDDERPAVSSSYRGRQSFGPVPGLPARPGVQARARVRVRARRRRSALGLGQLLAGIVVLAALLVVAALVLPAAGRTKAIAAPAGRVVARQGTVSAAGRSVPGVNAGIFSQVATVGSTAVAAGVQAGGQPEFVASRDGGRTWGQATVRSTSGPTGGHPATLVAGGPGGWTALGPRAIWTSSDGLTWTLDSGRGLGQAGDVVTAVTSTRSGFLATGTNAAAGTGLVWTSANGVSWHRFTAAGFGLAKQPGEQVFSMNYATTSANRTLIVGAAHEAGKTCWYVWLSGNGGTLWTTVVVPMNHGGGARFAGLGTSTDGFIAVRPGQTSSGRADAVVYRSSNAVDWRFESVITDPQGFSPVQVTGSAGTIAGFVIAGRDRLGNLVEHESTDNATTWTRSRSFGKVPAGQSLGVAVLPDGTVVMADFSGQSGQPRLLEVPAQGADPRPIILTSKG
jgi:hypothetical protein